MVRSMIKMAAAVTVILVLASTASAAQIYAGQMTTTKDTTASGCGEALGKSFLFFYRPKSAQHPAGLTISMPKMTTYLQNTDDSGEFDFTGVRGKMVGTAITTTSVQRFTLRGNYAIKTNNVDPEFILLNSVTLNFNIKETGQNCAFASRGVMTLALAAEQPPQAAELTDPAPGSTFTSDSVTFSWSPGVNISAYRLMLGSGPFNLDNIYNSGELEGVLSHSLPFKLPCYPGGTDDSRRIFVSLLSRFPNNTWDHPHPPGGPYIYYTCN
jgi:hypothetical protein